MSVRQLTFEDAAQAKRSGMARAWDNAGEWRRDAMTAVRTLLILEGDGALLNADTIRAYVEREAGEPPNPKATWGAFIGTLARKRWIVWTGRFVTSKQTQGHANPIREWRVNRAAVLRGPTKKKEAAA